MEETDADTQSLGEQIDEDENEFQRPYLRYQIYSPDSRVSNFNNCCLKATYGKIETLGHLYYEK